MRTYSLAYLTAANASVNEALDMAFELGYAHVGLRLMPNAPGAPHQALLGQPARLREAQARVRNTGVGVFDLEIVRIASVFDAKAYLPLFEAGQALGARAVLVAGDDPDPARLAAHYADLCETMRPFGLSADLEFMPWTAVKNARDAVAVLEQAAWPDNAGILVDAIHFGRSHTRLEDIANLPPRYLHYAQIGDAVAGTHFSTEEMIHTARCERALPGEGTIALAALFAALPATLPISVEVAHLEQAKALGDKAWAALALAAAQRVLEPNAKFAPRHE